jgi:hypothetical protein
MGALERAPRLLDERLGVLEARLHGGDETAWSEYLQVVVALTAVLAHAAPGAGGRLVTTKELGTLLGLSPKAILKRRKAGAIGGAVQLGQRGRGALRWDIGAAVSGAGR